MRRLDAWIALLGPALLVVLVGIGATFVSRSNEIHFLNALAAVAVQSGGLAGISRIVKVTGFVASAPGFNGQPDVLNGASELLGEVFGDAGLHARSAVGVAELPMDAPVEVELVVMTNADARGE